MDSRRWLDRFVNDSFKTPGYQPSSFSDSDSAFATPAFDDGWPSTAAIDESGFNSTLADRQKTASGTPPPLEGFSLLDLINSLWDGQTRSAFSRVDVKETPTAYVFSAEAPGFTREDLKVQVDDTGYGGRMLVISGGKETTGDVTGVGGGGGGGRVPGVKSKKVEAIERASSFVRRFKLPKDSDPDSTTAHCEHGDLTVVVPKLGAAGRVIDVRDLAQSDVQAVRIEEIDSDEEEREQQQQQHQQQPPQQQEQYQEAKGKKREGGGGGGGGDGARVRSSNAHPSVFGGDYNHHHHQQQQQHHHHRIANGNGMAGGREVAGGVAGRDLNSMDTSDMFEFPETPSAEVMAAHMPAPIPRIVQVVSPTALRTEEVVEMEEREPSTEREATPASRSGWKRLDYQLPDIFAPHKFTGITVVRCCTRGTPRSEEENRAASGGFVFHGCESMQTMMA
ncbi:hypothetical protein CBR_g30297 [Chara braunii]|uniref:SHSP domain-containing protein n=1 Tax=Chara braunii TaxID=69332 RepID=A0A388JX74_CHABU|nr:hypothetical protein CBR_g30297 [Chara braunii]|eukprot:GBG62343.1 hypothetical protein CBR_g30297 [Chara braunii]